MRRLQLFEFTDLPGCPEPVRRLVTDYLRCVLRLFRIEEPLAALLRRLVERTGTRRLVDLCSGASGPLLPLQRRLAAAGVAVPVLLTDRFPNLPAFAAAAREGQGAVDYAPGSVDATRVPAELDGARTLFQSLHHFPPAAARAILADAARRGAGIGVFEVTAREWLPILSSFLLIPLVLVITPFIRPLTLSRLLLTYVLPIAPLVICWDALVSSLRSYTVAELRELSAGLATESGGAYVWEAGQVRHYGFPVTYLLGYPREGGHAGPG
jgi:hypothetical protein